MYQASFSGCNALDLYSGSPVLYLGLGLPVVFVSLFRQIMGWNFENTIAALIKKIYILIIHDIFPYHYTIRPIIYEVEGGFKERQ
jgi:hypothetical protein